MDPIRKNRGPLLVDKLRGYFKALPEWVQAAVPIRTEKQKIDAQETALSDLSGGRVEVSLTQEVTDEKLRQDRFIDNYSDGSNGSEPTFPIDNVGQVVLPETGQVASQTQTVSDRPMTLSTAGPPLQSGKAEDLGGMYIKTEVSAPTFDKKVYQEQRSDAVPDEFKGIYPERTEVHLVDGDATMTACGEMEWLRKEEQVKVGVKQTTVTTRQTEPTRVLQGRRVEPQWNGATLELERKIVPANTKISQVFGMVDAKIVAFDETRAVSEIWRVDNIGFPPVDQYNYDPEINASVLTRLTIVAQGTSFTPTDGVLEWSDRKIDAKHTLRVVNYPAALPTETTYTTQMFTFPSILTSLDFVLAAIGQANRSEARYSAGVRASYTAPTQIRTVSEYFWSPPSPLSVIGWAPGDIIFKGVSYSISLSNMLYNTWSNVGVTYAGDVLYGNLVDRFTINATSPSASTYISMIGTSQCISSTVEWYKRVWRRKSSYVVLQ